MSIQEESRAVRGIGMAVWSLFTVYIAYSIFNNYGRTLEGIDPVGGGVALAVFLFMVGMGAYAIFFHAKSAKFFLEVEIESRKINWPIWSLVKTSTGQVVVVMVFLSIFLRCVDIVLGLVRSRVF